MAWDVEYEDGDEGTDLCRKCVRPYTPYAVQESLEIRVSEHEFATGRVLAVNPVNCPRSSLGNVSRRGR